MASIHVTRPHALFHDRKRQNNPWRALRDLPHTPPLYAAGYYTSAAPSIRWTPLENQGVSQLADSLHCCATVGIRPPPSFLTRYSALTRHRLHHMRPNQLSTVVRSMVALGFSPDEEWLSDFDSTCYNHPGPFDASSIVQVLAGLTALPSGDFRFPQAVYLKVLSNPNRFDDYVQLACLLYCLGSHNVPLWDEGRFLDTVGRRMGQLLATMSDSEAQRAVTLSLSRSGTLGEVLRLHEHAEDD